ncbi:MAG: biotin--[acetyl-CoA-carboxylase] ligase [Lachnospiraceae bacterium]|nr:biotin--[acetyl-CoA-carboxylase] ligase [Lachnospiraceae bacterium]
MKAEILKMLRESGGYLSGQELCERFQVSRTAVWKVISQLKEEGYEIEAVRNKGYHLKESPDVLSKEEIESRIDTRTMGRCVEYFPETDSTNIRAKQAAGRGAAHGMLFVADRQSAGKGRRGRSWDSPEGTEIFMSLLLRPKFAPGKAPMLTILMAIAAAEAVRAKTDLDVKIKWPNDLVTGGRKICGILTEMSAEIDYIDHVVIGVGVNVNRKTFPEELREKATSLLQEGGVPVKRSELIAEIMCRFEKLYEQFEKEQSLHFVQQRYNEQSVNCGQKVTVLEPQRNWDGLALGINEAGELLVENEAGEILTVYAGEVSVRGIYGYV